MSGERTIFYTPPDIVLALAKTPRFGHTNYFPDVLEAGEARTDYMTGLIFAGAIVMGFFVLWSIFIIMLMRMGSKRVGYLSGSPIRTPATVEAALAAIKSPSMMGNTKQESLSMVEENEQEVLRQYSSRASCANRPTRIRSCFLLCGAIFVTFSVLIVTQGLAHLQNTLDIFYRSSVEVNNLTVEGLLLIEDGFVRSGEIAEEVQSSLVKELGIDFCPSQPALGSLPQAQELQDQASSGLAQLDQLNSFLDNGITDVRAALIEARDASAAVSDQLNTIDLTSWQALLVLIPYSVVPALLMAGVFMATFDVSFPTYTCVINWFLFPLFVILVIVAWVVASLMIIAAGVNGDFCLPGGRVTVENDNTAPPDESVLDTLTQLGYANTTTFDVAAFYISQCTKENDPFSFLTEIIPELEAGSVALSESASLFNNTDVVSQISLFCNRDFGVMEALITEMEGLLVLLVKAIRDTLELIACDRIVPLYTETVYEGMCTYSPKAVFWVFSCALIIGFFGMVMIMLRSSYKGTFYMYPETQPDTDEDYVIDEIEPRSHLLAAEPPVRTVERFYGSDDDDCVTELTMNDPCLIRVPASSTAIIPRKTTPPTITHQWSNSSSGRYGDDDFVDDYDFDASPNSKGSPRQRSSSFSSGRYGDDGSGASPLY